MLRTLCNNLYTSSVMNVAKTNDDNGATFRLLLLLQENVSFLLKFNEGLSHCWYIFDYWEYVSKSLSYFQVTVPVIKFSRKDDEILKHYTNVIAFWKTGVSFVVLKS